MSATHNDHGAAEVATVHYLDHRRDDAENTPNTAVTEREEVLEGELVDEQEYRRLTNPQTAALDRYAGYKNDLVRAGRGVRTVATHPVTRSTGARVLVAGVTTAQGVQSWAKRAWDASTHGTYRRALAAAEAAGDREGMADWADRIEQAKERRHKRLMDLPRLGLNLVKIALGSVAGFVAIVLITGILSVTTGTAGFLDPAYGVLNAIRWIFIVVSAGWTPVLAAAPLVLALAAWREGRKRQTPPIWLQRVTPGSREGGTVITADAIVVALHYLGIPKLDQWFKKDWVPTFDTPPVKDGNGYRAVVELPMGATPEMVADKRAVLAKNLHREEVEVWPADAAKSGGHAGWLDLWVANPGVLSQPAPQYPLLHAGTGDVFAGVPLGVTQRGDALVFPLVDANFVFGGMMGQGKSNGGRVVMLGAALDPLCELWVHVFAGNGDFDAYQPRLARYQRGADDETAATGLDSLRELYDEVTRRENRLAELGAKKVTRALAEKHPDLRPLVSFYSECHELFGHKDYGQQAADYAVQVIRRGRKTGLILGFDTQSSRKEAIPPKIVELVKLNCCFAVKTWRSNDGFLGDGSFASGIRATELRPGKDKGTCLVTGASEEAFEIVKTHYIEVDDDTGYDAATDVIARAVSHVNPTVPVEATAQAPAHLEQDRDLLEDLDQILGTDKVNVADLPPLLRELAPTYPGYRDLNGKQLAQQLTESGVRVPTTNNRPKVNPVTVRHVLASRSTADLDDD